MIIEEKLFPRGGKKELKEREESFIKRKKRKIDNDDLFNDSKKTGKKINSSIKTTKKKKEVVSNLETKYAQILSYNDLTEGLTLLGVVNTVAEYECKINIGGCIAILPLTQLSKTYTKALENLTRGVEENNLKALATMLLPGMVVSVTITSIEKLTHFHYRVFVSSSPDLVVRPNILRVGSVLLSAVKSIEDYGYVMDIGSSTPGFMIQKNASKYKDTFLNGEEFGIGQLVPSIVTQMKSAAISISCHPSKLKSLSFDDSQTSIDLLLPGMGFKVKFQSEVRRGIKVTFANNLEAIVHRDHFPSLHPDWDPEIYYDARILYVIPTLNTVYMTLKNELWLGNILTPPKEHKIGDLIQGKIVYASNDGVYLDKDDVIRVRVNLNQLSDNEILPQNIKRNYPLESVKRVRLLQYDYISGHFIGSMKSKMLSSDAIVDPNTLELGAKVKGKIKEFRKKGVVVICGNKTAFIPSLHLSDVPLSHPEKKFSVGDVLSCRVLRLDSEKNQFHLTSKNILVKGDYPIISSYDVENIGILTEGVVTSINKKGIGLQFYGNAYGWVPKSHLSDTPIDYPEKLFFLGQCLKCKILSVDEKQERIILSLNIGGKIKPLDLKLKKKTEIIQRGKMYSGVVSAIASDGVTIQVTVNEISIECFIPKGHLSDHTGLLNLLLTSYTLGDTLENVLCFAKDVVPIFTLKESLISYNRENHVESYEDVYDGYIVPGVVSLIKPYGVFLKLPLWKLDKGVLVPIRHISDQFIQNIEDIIFEHQTIMGRVIEKKDEGKKITLSAKLSDVYSSDQSISLLISYFSNLRHIFNKSSSCLRNYQPNNLVTVTVESLNPFGLFVVADNNIKGIITTTNCSKEIVIGKKLTAVVLNVDFENSVLELSANKDLISKSKLKKDKVYPKEAEIVKCRPLLIKSDDFIVTMVIEYPEKYVGHFVYLSSRKHINDFIGFSDYFSEKQLQTIQICGKEWNRIIGVLYEENSKKRQRDSLLLPITTTKEEKVVVKQPRKDLVKEAVEVSDPGWGTNFNPWSEESSKLDVNDEKVEPQKKQKTHLSKKEKKELDKLEKDEIDRVEQSVVEGKELEPSNENDFEKIVLSSPDSSLVWIKYMAFYLEKKQIQKAREIAKRALSKINFRNEEDKLNVHIAWFNLENTFGSEDETEALFREALRSNDQYKVYSHVASIYTATNKIDKAESVYKMMVRKFSQEIDVWIKLGLHYYKHNNWKEARFTLQRSIQNLSSRDHVIVTMKYAQLEFKYGEKERGKTLFETILGNYPRRIDLWNVYIDALIKINEIEETRNVFERMIQLNLAPKKMKMIFKKYIDFEAKQQDEFKIDRIRKKALEYVESKVGETIES